jgi:adenylate cyclase
VTDADIAEEAGDADIPPLPAAPSDLPTLRSMLASYGVGPEEIAEAERNGTLGYLAIEHLVFPDPAVYDLESLADVTGMPAHQIVQLWRSLGFPDPVGGERIFTETDADMLAQVAGLMQDGLLEPDLTLQMSRVIGSSLARVAVSMIDALGLDEAHDPEDGDFAVAAGTLMPTMPRIMDYVWRRHLQAAARRSAARESQDDVPSNHKAVGFADLVGFTALSQQVDEHVLAAVVDRFESIAYDTVVKLGGRVVKMIGDEVMFVVDEVRPAVEIAVTLAQAYSQDEELSEVRVGLAFGPVLEREADYYGPTVNLASRIVGIAFPGSVVCSDDVHAALEDDSSFSWRSLKQRRLKDIGKVSLWSVRRSGDDDRRRSASERDRRRKAERWEEGVERLSTRLERPIAADEAVENPSSDA